MERTQFPGGTFTRSRPAPFHGPRAIAISQQLRTVPPDVMSYRSFPRNNLDFHTLLTAILGCKLPKRRTVLVKNPYTLLSQKELEVARVRKEIRALLTVIPLLARWPPLLGRTPDTVTEFLSGH